MPRISRPWRSQAPAPEVSPGEGGDAQPPTSVAQQAPTSAPPANQSPIGQVAAPQSPARLAPEEPLPAGPQQIAGVDPGVSEETPGFGTRGQMRRRLHFLRKARELGYRDLGGLVFDLHRFRQRHDELVIAKLATLEHIDRELRALENALSERRDVTVLREAGIAACPRCAAIHGSDDRFCPSCGIAMGPHVDRPIAAPAGAPVPQAPAPAPAQPQPAQPQPQPQSQQRPPVQPTAPAPQPPADPPARSSSELLRPSPRADLAREEDDRPTRIIPPGEQPAMGFAAREREGQAQSGESNQPSTARHDG